MNDELQKTNPIFCRSEQATSKTRAGGGSSNKKKRYRTPPPQLLTPKATKIPIWKQLLDTCTDEQYKEIINQLPAAWQATNEKGDRVTKSQLQMIIWEEYKDDHNAH
jgi:hypothetical protein